MEDALIAEAGSNRLLGALSSPALERLSVSLSPTRFHVDDVLFERGLTSEAVCFPISAVIGLAVPFRDGAVVEVGTVGNEGVVGIPAAGGGSLALRATCRVAGSALTMASGALQDAVTQVPVLGSLLDAYVQALLAQIAQEAMCSRLHSTEERLGRWLLTSHDRAGVDHFAITGGFLSKMVGRRGAAISRSVEILQAAGLIRYRGGAVTVLDRHRLELVSCGCYGAITAQLDGVVTTVADLRGQGSRIRRRPAEHATHAGRPPS